MLRVETQLKDKVNLCLQLSKSLGIINNLGKELIYCTWCLAGPEKLGELYV